MASVLDLAQLAEKVDGLVKKIVAIAPKDWKGNCPPDTHHFDAGSINPQAYVDGNAQKVRVTFDYSDAGVVHTIDAVMPWDQVGIRGGADQITVDGVALSGADFVIGHREGLEGLHWYTRIVCEFRGTLPTGAPVHFRFDGEF